MSLPRTKTGVAGAWIRSLARHKRHQYLNSVTDKGPQYCSFTMPQQIYSYMPSTIKQRYSCIISFSGDIVAISWKELLSDLPWRRIPFQMYPMTDKKDWWPELKKQMAALLKLCLHFGLVINLCEISFKCWKSRKIVVLRHVQPQRLLLSKEINIKHASNKSL